jgi:hypothetical protein
MRFKIESAVENLTSGEKLTDRAPLALARMWKKEIERTADREDKEVSLCSIA